MPTKSKVKELKYITPTDSQIPAVDLEPRSRVRVYYLDYCSIENDKLCLEVRNKTSIEHTLDAVLHDYQHYLLIATNKVNKSRMQSRFSLPLPGRRNSSVGSMSALLSCPIVTREQLTYEEHTKDDENVIDVKISFDMTNKAMASFQQKIYQKAMEKLKAFQSLKDMQFI